MKHLKSFPDYFIINESRAEVIDSKGVSMNPYKDVLKHPKEILDKYAPWYNPTKVATPLFRNVTRENYDEYLLIDPSKEKRKHKGKGFSSERNYINLIVDFSWKGYPKRSNSIIGLTHKRNNMYGVHTYRVIPLKKNSKVGFAAKEDFWYSFELDGLLSELDFENDVNYTSTSEVNSIIQHNIKLKKDYDTLKDFKNDLKSVNFNENVHKDLDSLKELKEIENKYGSIYDFLLKYINPENPTNTRNYEFKSLNYNLNTYLEGVREFWTTAPCLMIKENWKEYGSLNDVYSKGF